MQNFLNGFKQIKNFQLFILAGGLVCTLLFRQIVLKKTAAGLSPAHQA